MLRLVSYWREREKERERERESNNEMAKSKIHWYKKGKVDDEIFSKVNLHSLP